MADWVTISSLATAGGTLVLSRFALLPRDDGGWIAAASRHWNIDGADPR